MLFQTLGIPDSGSLFPQNNGGKSIEGKKKRRGEKMGDDFISLLKVSGLSSSYYQSLRSPTGEQFTFGITSWTACLGNLGWSSAKNLAEWPRIPFHGLWFGHYDQPN
ncbi:hypothetical protein Peur_021862 [Populus x canadensis]